MLGILRHFRVVVVLLALTLGLVALAPVAPASAGTGLIYTVVDADNDPYSGIYLRDGTSMSNVRRIAERYMPYGTTVEELCYAWGEAVGPYANRVWHKVRVANGATTNQIGWTADRYLNTPVVANQVLANWPKCDAPPPAAPVIPVTYNGSVFYASAENEASPANIHMTYNQWTAGNCSSAKAGNFPSWIAPANKFVTQMAGFSIGRLGPAYFLSANPGRWQEIDYILLLDPGNADELLKNKCDKAYNEGKLYTDWLKANPNARLVILAGAVTADSHHRGIQTAYFDYLRANGGPRNRVVVCNYDGMDHHDLYRKFSGSITQPLITKTTCPGNETWAWNP
jgi:hypothetical protein